MAKDKEDILEIRAKDIIEDDIHPAKELMQTPPAVSPARTAAVRQGNVLLNRDASYEEQFADRIQRLKRPHQPRQPRWKHGWVFLVLAVAVLVPVLLLRAVLNHQQQEKSKDEERAALKREQRALRKQGGWGVGHPVQVDERLAAELSFRQGIEAIANQNYDEAIRLLSRYLQDHKVAAAYSARGLAFYHKKDYDRAAGDYSEAIRLDPHDAFTLNNLAWVLATCPNDQVRDGQRAVEYASRACDLSNWRHFGNLDTLAAAYAEAGNFKEAVKWQTKAFDFAIEDWETLAQAQQRLKLYEQGKPYRE